MSPTERGIEPDKDCALRSAVLPFHFCERYRLPCAYERSIRIEANQIRFNRFVLGFPAALANQGLLADLFKTFNFPKPALTSRLRWQASRASTIYLGYEETEAGHTRRLYFEYWDEAAEKLSRMQQPNDHKKQPHSIQPLPIGIGYKWNPEIANHLNITEYSVLPVTTKESIQGFCLDALKTAGVPAHTSEAAGTFIARVLAAAPNLRPIVLNAQESENQRNSFDLCLHPFNLSTQKAWPWLAAMAAPMLTAHGMKTLKTRWPSGSLVTHLSGGLSNQGNPYLGIYYRSDLGRYTADKTEF